MLNGLSLRRFSAQNVSQDDSFHVPKDGVCGSQSEASFLGDYLCWNFGRLVPGTLGSHGYQTKTHGSHHLGAQFGHKISSS